MVEKVNPVVFTIDVEDGISLVMRDVFQKPIEQTDRVLRTTREILELLEKRQVKATFFTLGIVGEKFPELVKEIVEQGHELAVHGHNHLMFYDMTPQKALEELTTAKDILEQISGQKIYGHRAPAFSISKKTPWAFEVLIEAGFSYDSSIMPVKSKYNGWVDFPLEITNIKTQNGSLIEFPISVIKAFDRQLPFSGGGYLRFLPTSLIKSALKKATKDKPGVIYVHPYEFDTVKYPDFYFEEMKHVDWKKRLKLKSNFVNRSNSIGKINALLNNFEFKTMYDILSSYGQIDSTVNIKI